MVRIKRPTWPFGRHIYFTASASSSILVLTLPFLRNRLQLNAHVYVRFESDCSDVGLLDVDFWCTGEIEIRTSVDPIYKNTSQIYKGIMACDVGQDILVVCKLTPARYAHQAYREAEFYARELRGAEFVPKTYRFSQVGTGDDIHLCLLMEDCGEPLKQRFYQLGWEMK
ncbi:hypothetical protein CERSUDRAFT_74019 [Gelatoporia subvermispora B]|uniref:Protein kinase domain-containing protein n=1 Tax=Ceriporiopsis subvermispora (strain B) TaxID=914234 RepID=M2RDX7_CERS8|nr:hypothetical protein CERSUDRAFT_74019 [Gelatoporia subvermispora B]